MFIENAAGLEDGGGEIDRSVFSARWCLGTVKGLMSGAQAALSASTGRDVDSSPYTMITVIASKSLQHRYIPELIAM